MRLGELWDYFMRRKSLLLLVVTALVTVLALGYLLGSRQARRTTEVELPRTGEIIVAEVETEDEIGCDADLVERAEMSFGNGENGSETMIEPDIETTFWGAEAPAAFMGTDQLAAEMGEKNESVIVATGLLAAIVVLGAGKFVFDRYVR